MPLQRNIYTEFSANDVQHTCGFYNFNCSFCLTISYLNSGGSWTCVLKIEVKQYNLNFSQPQKQYFIRGLLILLFKVQKKVKNFVCGMFSAGYFFEDVSVCFRISWIACEFESVLKSFISWKTLFRLKACHTDFLASFRSLYNDHQKFDKVLFMESSRLTKR